jgi:hypothetical protein
LGVGAVVMAAGTLLPWVAVQTRSGPVAVSGFGHGAGYILALAGAIVVLLCLRRELLAALATIFAAALLALIMYELPGAMLDTLPAWEAGLTWGAMLSELGSVVGLVACGSAALHAVEKGLLQLAVARGTRRV